MMQILKNEKLNNEIEDFSPGLNTGMPTHTARPAPAPTTLTPSAPQVHWAGTRPARPATLPYL